MGGYRPLDDTLLAIGPARRYATVAEGRYVEGPVAAFQDEFRQGQAARRRVHDAVPRITAGHIDVLGAALPATDDGGQIERVAGVMADPAAPQFEGLQGRQAMGEKWPDQIFETGRLMVS